MLSQSSAHERLSAHRCAGSRNRHLLPDRYRSNVAPRFSCSNDTIVHVRMSRVIFNYFALVSAHRTNALKLLKALGASDRMARPSCATRSPGAVCFLVIAQLGPTSGRCLAQMALEGVGVALHSGTLPVPLHSVHGHDSPVPVSRRSGTRPVPSQSSHALRVAIVHQQWQKPPSVRGSKSTETGRAFGCRRRNSAITSCSTAALESSRQLGGKPTRVPVMRFAGLKVFMCL